MSSTWAIEEELQKKDQKNLKRPLENKDEAPDKKRSKSNIPPNDNNKEGEDSSWESTQEHDSQDETNQAPNSSHLVLSNKEAIEHMSWGKLQTDIKILEFKGDFPLNLTPFIGYSFPSLQGIYVRGCEINTSSFEDIGKLFPGITTLILEDNTCTFTPCETQKDDGCNIHSITKLTNLTDLTIDNTSDNVMLKGNNLDDQVLSHIKKLTTITKLGLPSLGLTLKQLLQLPQRISTLDLSNNPLENPCFIKALSSLMNLQSLNLNQTYVREDFLQYLPTRLTDLALSSNVLKNTELSGLNRFTNLQTLNFSDNVGIIREESETLDVLKYLTNLTNLNMSYIEIPEKKFNFLTVLLNLTRLDVTDNGIEGDHMFDYVSVLTNLRHLVIKEGNDIEKNHNIFQLSRFITNLKIE